MEESAIDKTNEEKASLYTTLNIPIRINKRIHFYKARESLNEHTEEMDFKVACIELLNKALILEGI